MKLLKIAIISLVAISCATTLFPRSTYAANDSNCSMISGNNTYDANHVKPTTPINIEYLIENDSSNQYTKVTLSASNPKISNPNMTWPTLTNSNSSGFTYTGYNFNSGQRWRVKFDYLPDVANTIINITLSNDTDSSVCTINQATTNLPTTTPTPPPTPITTKPKQNLLIPTGKTPIETVGNFVSTATGTISDNIFLVIGVAAFTAGLIFIWSLLTKSSKHAEYDNGFAETDEHAEYIKREEYEEWYDDNAFGKSDESAARMYKEETGHNPPKDR